MIATLSSAFLHHQNMSVHNGESSNDFFINPDGLKLFEQIWTPDCETIRAMVFLIHGLSEHSSFFYFDSVVKPLNSIGCLVAAHDHIGHGRSDGNRKVLEKIDNLTRDVVCHIEYLRKKLSVPDNVPTFLYGHSLGGLIACKIAIERPELISGMVLEAPALTLNGRNDTGNIFMFAIWMLSFLMPSYVLKKPVFENLTQNSEVIQKAIEDNLRNKDGLTMGTAVNIGFAIRSVQCRLKEIKTPFFVAHGKKDVVMSSIGSENLKNEAEVEDKLFVEYEDGYHILRADSGEMGEDFKKKLVEWIDQRIKN